MIVRRASLPTTMAAVVATLAASFAISAAVSSTTAPDSVSFSSFAFAFSPPPPPSFARRSASSARASTFAAASRRTVAFAASSSIEEGGGGGGDGTFEDGLVQKQVAKSSELKSSVTTTTEKEPYDDAESHLSHQREVFDSFAEFFRSDDATPPEVVPVLTYLAGKVISDMVERSNEGRNTRNERTVERSPDEDAEVELEGTKTEFRLLDVACGTGAMFPFLLEAADDAGISLRITGVDLAPGMVEGAKEYGAKALETTKGGQHSVEAVCGDFVRLAGTELEEGGYDAVLMNACFGNFFDPSAVLDAAASSLGKDGVLFVTHPLGSAFVDKLHEEDPSTVPHRLPQTEEEWREMCLGRPLRTMDFVEETPILESAEGGAEGAASRPVYLASAGKTRDRSLPSVLRFRGPVAEGYGRGGKKLGFPTANLPSSLFQDALEDVDAGVYLGWAVVEGDGSGRNAPHKAVVNVGYSPTFEGSENPEKIVEAHLILSPETASAIGDFYGETMRLSLVGYLRPEMKFPSFPSLVTQITDDRDDAREALDRMPYTFFGTEDPFVIGESDGDGSGVWIGGDGGDEKASWEFRSLGDALKGR